MGSIEVAVTVAASSDAAYACFTDPGTMVRWMGVDVVLDPNPGGELRIDVNGRDVAAGEFVEVEPPDHVQFTWGWEGNVDVPPGGSTVDVTFTSGDTGTIVRLLHSGLSEEQAARHAAGWRHYLDRLAVAAAGGDPGRDPWIDVDQ
jgi:uncharacterized protein YndB with AHSA1/START domain